MRTVRLFHASLYATVATTATIAVLFACACGEDAEPVVEYPPGASPNEESGDDGGAARDAEITDARADAPVPASGQKLSNEPVYIEGVTEDGHLVLSIDADLAVWPKGAAAPTVLVTDFDTGFDSLVIRGRFVAAWLGESVLPSAPKLWSKASGITTLPIARRDALFAQPASEAFAYYAPGASILSTKVTTSTAGGTTHTVVVPSLDVSAIEAQCAPRISFAPAGLVVGGCVDGASTATVATYGLDGAGVTKTILTGAAPGLWLDHTRTRALVQTASQSSIRVLTGTATPVVLDTAIRQAVFSNDDSKVVYLRSDGTLRRAATSTPVSPVTLRSGVTAILAVSGDSRFTAFSTSGNVSDRSTDVIVIDANAPASPRTLATEKAAVYGISKAGTELVHLAPRDIASIGPLYVTALPSGTSKKISEEAERVVFDGSVVYWQELDKTTKTTTLKAVRVADVAGAAGTSAVKTIERGLDSITTHVALSGDTLYVGSKLGLWKYPAIAP